MSGTFFSNPDADEVMLGSGLARALGAKTGDLVTVMATTPDGALNAVDASVVAVLSYPIKEIDDRLLFLPYAAASKLLKSEGKANTLVVLLEGRRRRGCGGARPLDGASRRRARPSS